ncbi:MAG: hypothetical protein L0Y72_31685 [Gemmataceae bacterium]|nr:hypothetical protein [Gemmataceae bacterium]MCI0743615.1 hypothetical protein [Gemmataceae bacterium]
MQPPQPKRVAALVTEYRRWSHADVIVGKILEGYYHDGKEFPRMRLVSMYVDQFPERDMSLNLAKRHGFTLANTIEEALTLGRKEVVVDGVLSIGEHGKYPTNDRGQLLYPRRRFFEGTANVFERYKRSVPVFNDKHLAATWQDARWMYDRARELHVPFMAGSSLPVTWRRPVLRIPRNADITEAVQIGYGPFEGYGFHALESLQCMVERRRGGETGVRSVQCLQGEEMWRAMDRGAFSRELMEAAMERVPAHAQGDYRKLTAKARDSGVFLIEYRDGLRASVVMPNGWVHEGDGGAFTFACRVRGQDKPLSTHFYLQQPDPFGHFAHLLRAIDSMFQTGHPAYPAERTLLTTGILDAVMISRHEKHRRVDTPFLDFRYTPTDWGFASDAVPKPIKR